MDLKTEAQYQQELSVVWGMLDTERRAREWQPIETAPKDGTEVLVCGGTYSTGLHNGMPLHGAVIAFWDRTHWHGPEANAHDEWWECRPTNWMPLPMPPN